MSRPICVRRLNAFSVVSLALASLSVGARTDQLKWSLYALGGFSVALPGQPVSQSTQSSVAGYRAWSATLGEDPVVFSIAQVKGDEAKTPPDALLAQCIAGIVSAANGSITAERDVLFEGWPGVELHYKKDSGQEGELRAYVVKDQIVNLIVSHPPGSVEPEGVSKYFNSLKLPSDIQKGPFALAGPTLEKYELEQSGFSAKVPRGARSGTSKLGDGPAAVNMHRFAAAYVNRLYMGIVFDPPSGASKDLDGDTSGKAAQAVNTTIAGILRQVISKTDSKDTPAGKGWVADFEAGHGLIGHVETYIRNNHTYSLLAIVPGSMMKSDEVQGFFSSVTLPKKQ